MQTISGSGGFPLFVAVLIAFSRRWPNLRETWSVIASVLKFAIILSMVPAVLAGDRYQWTLCQITDTVGLTLRTDPAGMIFCCTCFYVVGTDELLLHRLHAL